MRKPKTIEWLYIDFDGFFAAIEEQINPALRGHPVGVIPFANTTSTCVIASNAMAKRAGITTAMAVTEARKICPKIKLVPQKPDLYVRAHHALLNQISHEIPIDAVCSIDELTCRLERKDIQNPVALAEKVKARLCHSMGKYITCSIGFAPNRQLAKIACKMQKPDGITILNPEDLPGPLLDLSVKDIPGIGKRMQTRLFKANIYSMKSLWRCQPKHLRALWGSVTGERVWYALHGYALHASQTQPHMFGHGRVLPPEWRDWGHARDCARLLTIKSARRLRRAGYLAKRFCLWLTLGEDNWSGETFLGETSDDYSSLLGLNRLWPQARCSLPRAGRILRVHVAHTGLTANTCRQMDLFEANTAFREKWQRLNPLIDGLNSKYAMTVVSQGPWTPPPGGFAGGKIAYARVPDMEDFW